MGVILQKHPGARKAQNTPWRITRRLDLWEAGQYATLLADTTEESQYQTARAAHFSDEIEDRCFNLKVLNVKLCAAVRGICGQGMDGGTYPGGADSKTGKPVMDVQREKHPALRTPELSNPVYKYFN